MKPATPLPWQMTQPAHDPQAWDIVDANGGAFAKLTWYGGKQNAAYIVIACNAFPELVAALREVIGHGYLETKHPASQDYVSKAAIAKVRSLLASMESNA